MEELLGQQFDIELDRSTGVATMPTDANTQVGPSFDGASWKVARRYILTLWSQGVRPINAPPWARDENTDQLYLPMKVALVPRPDNEFNDGAVSVAVPARFGGTPQDRHMAFMYDKHLWHLAGAAHAIVEATGQELEAYAWAGVHRFHYLWDIELQDPNFISESDIAKWRAKELSDYPATEDDLTSDGHWFTRAEVDRFDGAISGIRYTFPRDGKNGERVEAFLKGLPSRTGFTESHEDVIRKGWLQQFAHVLSKAHSRRVVTGAWGRETERSRATDGRNRQAELDLIEWDRWRQESHTHLGLSVSRQVTFGYEKIVIRDSRQRRVATMHANGLLTLVDERTRTDAVAALRAAGIQATWPTFDESAPYPDAVIEPKHDWWGIRKVMSNGELGIRIGHYEHETGQLLYYARPHREVILNLLVRHGLNVTQANFDSPNSDVAYLNSLTERGAGEKDGHTVSILSSMRHLVPDAYESVLDVTWLDEPRPNPFRAEPDPDIVSRPHVPEFYGVDVNTSLRWLPCRLCGGYWHAPRDRPAYCNFCRSAARNGTVLDRGRDGPWMEAVTWALQTVAELEFGGPPARRQLATMLVTDPSVADQIMVARWLLPTHHVRPGLRADRPALSWTQWLARAGLLGDGLRIGRGVATVATDGHLCRSLMERHVDDFLNRWRIHHEVEPVYPFHPKWNPNGMRADWLLPGGVYVEAFGLPDEPNYSERMERKRALVEELGIEWVTLTHEDLGDLPDVFERWRTH